MASFNENIQVRSDKSLSEERDTEDETATPSISPSLPPSDPTLSSTPLKHTLTPSNPARSSARPLLWGSRESRAVENSPSHRLDLFLLLLCRDQHPCLLHAGRLRLPARPPLLNTASWERWVQKSPKEKWGGGNDDNGTDALLTDAWGAKPGLPPPPPSPRFHPHCCHALHRRI